MLKDLDTGTPDLVSLVIDLCVKREAALQNGNTIELHKDAFIVGTSRFSNCHLCVLNLKSVFASNLHQFCYVWRFFLRKKERSFLKGINCCGCSTIS